MIAFDFEICDRTCLLQANIVVSSLHAIKSWSDRRSEVLNI